MIKKISTTLVMAILFLVGYKYFEFKTISELSSIYSQSIKNELVLGIELDKVSRELGKKITLAMNPPKVSTSKSGKAEVKSDEQITNDAISAVNIIKEKNTEYIELLKKDKDRFIRLNKEAKFLFGNKGDFSKHLISKQVEYYEKEISVVENSMPEADFITNILNLMSEKRSVAKFSSVTNNNYKQFYKSFSLLAPIEKYTRDDFKFVGEDRIRERSKLSFEILNKQREYYRIYYQIVRDFVDGDNESANYKISKLVSLESGLNYDYSRAMSENEESDKEVSKGIVRNILDQVGLISDFKSKKLGVYPLVGSVGEWKDQLLLCDSYIYRVGLFKTITGGYVKSSNHSDLVRELSENAVLVTDDDRKFNEDNVSMINDDAKISITCTDQISGEKYIREISKN